MADKTIEELSKATELKDEDSFPIEQDGEPRRGTVGQLKDVAKSVAQPFADEAAKSAETAAEKANDAADVALHPPIIREGKWWTWNTDTNDYADSGEDAGLSLAIGIVTTGEPGTVAKVANRGTPTDQIWDITLPRGDPGPVSSVNGGTGDVVIGGRNLITKSSLLLQMVGGGSIETTEKIFMAGLNSAAASCAVCNLDFPAGTYTAHVICTNNAYPRILATVKPSNNVQVTENPYYEEYYGTRYIIGDLMSNENLTTFVMPSAFKLAFAVSSPTSGYVENTMMSIMLVSGSAALPWLPAPEDKADVPLQFDVKLPASGWASGQQTVKDARFIDGDYDWDVDVKGACIPWNGITITAGQMVAKADIVPTADMTWVVTRREVRRDG